MTDDSANETSSDTTRRAFVKAGAVTTGALATGVGVPVAAADDDDEDDNGDDDSGPFASVEFENQTSDGTQVTVQSDTLSQAGYVAFHDPSLLEGAVVDSVIGVTEYQERGIHYETEADLFDVPGADFEETSLEGTTPVVAMPHMETSGNETYDFVASGGEKDVPFAEAGLPVIDLGYVTVSEDSGETADEPFASVDFSNQELDDEVEVGEAVLSDGGFVTLHDARLLEGKVFESVVGVSEYLEPGRHRNVEVELDDPNDLTEVALPAPPVIPMAHMDTNGNEEYDFVDTEGAEDKPYTKAGQPVVDIGFVVRDDAEMEETEDETKTEDDH